MIKLTDILSEMTPTGGGGNYGHSGTGITTGDAWPDGIHTKAGRQRIMSPTGLMRGMTQLDFPIADAIYDNDEEYKGELRDDTPPLSPIQRTWRGTGPNKYQIPPESIDGVKLATGKEDGWWWSGYLPPDTAPEQGTPEASARKGDRQKADYRPVQKAATNVMKLDKKKRYHSGTYVKDTALKTYSDRNKFTQSQLKKQPKDWWNPKGKGPMQDGAIKLKDLI